MTAAKVDRRPASVALMWAHAVVLLVVCPVWAGANIAAGVGPTAGWSVFVVFATIGAVAVWCVRDNWGRLR